MDNMFTIIDPNIHLRPGWKSHVQSDGSNIGGVDPLHYGMVVGLPNYQNSVLFYTSGSTKVGGYADCEFYIGRQILPNTGNLKLVVDFSVDENYPSCAQALEMDTIFCLGGYNYNGSLQINNAESGMIQIAKADGGWIDTGIVVDLEPDAINHLEVQYQFDVANKKSSVISVVFNAGTYGILPTLRNIPAQQKGWTDQALFQFQLDLNAQAGAFSARVDNAQYKWW